ncbi:hypothetical protein [Actinomadura harenae]|uniref:Uncharacterized protein n=1 Tax=Actinomadura harenae TaxID=2483351 RepID=A0A3M2LXZ3_9ACTN|nr:hypothetical protein [Actinomadura harenae]RMI42072.1 hypothetical protein EBO15_20685 [Actinomadura harenae]
MTATRSLTRTLMVSTITMGMLAASTAAFAGTGSRPVLGKAPAPKHREMQRGMYVTGFNAAVAKAHGYKIVTYKNGDQQSVPIDPKSGRHKSPILHHGIRALSNTDYDEVSGNCGTAWIRVTQTAVWQVALVSGFRNTPEIAYDWSWTVKLSDQYGTSHQTAGGAMYGTQASRIWQNLTQKGWTFDWVDGGTALLINGLVCTAARPSVTIGGLG